MTSQTPPKDIFVSIAVSRPEGGLAKLPGALTGAKRMADWARSTKEYLVVHVDDSEHDVSVERIRGLVEEAIEKVHETSPLQRIVFYFAGHGAAQNTNDTLWLLSRWQTDPSEAIRVPILQRVLRTYQPAQVSFIGDSCRVVHKDFLDTLGSAVLRRRDEAPSEFELDQFFAADAGEAAFMVRPQGATEAFCIFTDVLLDALEGGAPGSSIARPNIGSVVTSGQLAAYLRSAVPLKASKHNVVLTPVPRPGFIEPRDVYATLKESVTLEADERPPPPPDPDTVPTVPPNIDAKRARRERDRRREKVKSLAALFAEEDHPPRFETRCGISIAGAEGQEIAAPPYAQITPDSEGNKTWFRVGKSDVEPMKRPFADLLVRVSRDHWAYAFAVPQFITALTIRNKASVGVISRQIGLQNEYRQTEDIVVRMNARLITGDESYDIAAMIREQKHEDFVSGIIAAYLYDSVGDIDNIRRIASYYVEHRQPVPFDVALLTDADIKLGPAYALKLDIPAVPERTPRTEIERRRAYTFAAMPARPEASILGTMPLMRQGWTLLELSTWVGGKLEQWRDLLVATRPDLTAAPFTTLRGGAAKHLAAAIRAGKPFS
jgi:hypothetical protein